MSGYLWWTGAGLLACSCVLFGLFLFYWVKYRKLKVLYQRLYNHARASGVIVKESEINWEYFGTILGEPMLTSAYPEEDPDDAA